MADLFVRQASVYASARPTYPASLFSFLASLTPSHSLAWDVGTGNGQAAASVAEEYENVIATDVTDQQLKYAIQRPNITYALTSTTLSLEEVTSVVGPEGAVDLVISAEALHWFDIDRFYGHVKRVLRKPGGVIAAWCYKARPYVSDAVDSVVDDFYEKTLPYWAPEVEYLESGYKTMPFPFAPVVDDERGTGPFEFECTKQASLADYLLNLRSWSAVQTALDQGHDLLNEDQQKLFADAWGPAETVRTMTWTLYALVGTVLSPP